jgi:8-oxo-dGTP diphosphatase
MTQHILVSAHLFVRSENRILIQRRGNTRYNPNLFGVISGVLASHEHPAHCAVREAAEEVGIGVDTDNLVYLCTISRRAPDMRCLEFVFETTAWRGAPRIMEPEKCAMLSFVEISAIPDDFVGYLRCALIALQRGHRYFEGLDRSPTDFGIDLMM